MIAGHAGPPRAQAAIITRLKAEGLSGFLKKPFSSGALNQMIQEILSTRP